MPKRKKIFNSTLTNCIEICYNVNRDKFMIAPSIRLYGLPYIFCSGNCQRGQRNPDRSVVRFLTTVNNSALVIPPITTTRKWGNTPKTMLPSFWSRSRMQSSTRISCCSLWDRDFPLTTLLPVVLKWRT